MKLISSLLLSFTVVFAFASADTIKYKITPVTKQMVKEETKGLKEFKSLSKKLSKAIPDLNYDELEPLVANIQVLLKRSIEDYDKFITSRSGALSQKNKKQKPEESTISNVTKEEIEAYKTEAGKLANATKILVDQKKLQKKMSSFKLDPDNISKDSLLEFSDDAKLFVNSWKERIKVIKAEMKKK